MWGIVRRITYNFFAISKSLLLYMFCGLSGGFSWNFGVLFFDCFSLGAGLLMLLFDLLLNLLFGFLFGLLFCLLLMGFFLHFGLFVLFLHFFSMLLHLFLMLLLHFFFRRLDLRIR